MIPPPQVLKVNSLRVFSLGFVIAGRSFLPVGMEKGQSIFSAALVEKFFSQFDNVFPVYIPSNPVNNYWKILVWYLGVVLWGVRLPAT